MRCPSCGVELTKVSILGFDDSLRCPKCGGVWAANWVVNNLVAGKEMRIDPLGAKVDRGDGKSVCPQDGTLLVMPAREAVPEDMVIEKCEVCGGWWFPGDEIFKFKQAFRARQEYVRNWRKSDWMAYAWPALVLALMIAGVGGGVWLVRYRQQAAIQASYGVREFVVIDYGKGQVEIRFKADLPVTQAEYKLRSGKEWHEAPAEPLDGGYVVKLTGLAGGQEYIVRVGGKEWRFTVRDDL